MALFSDAVYDPLLLGIPAGLGPYSLSSFSTALTATSAGFNFPSTAPVVFFALSSTSATVNNQAVVGIGYNSSELAGFSALAATYVVILSSTNGAVGNSGDVTRSALTVGIAPTSASVFQTITAAALFANRSSIVFAVPAAASTVFLQQSALGTNSDPNLRRINLLNG
jgi:hypothetical protein